jgi:hypothetical protein
MTLLQSAKEVLIKRTVSIYLDMRSEADPDAEEGYRVHFGDMGEMIHRIDNYPTFSAICYAVETGMFMQIGLADDDEDLEAFINEVKKYMSKN